MMRIQRFPMALLILALLFTCFLFLPFSGLAQDAESIDYASSVALDMHSETVKQFVTVKTFVDGDTTHFLTGDDGSVLKARYLAVNTPESTGKIEEWGMAASRFTREKLENAEEILIESDDEKWNPDSTSTRYLVWVWYRPHGEKSFRSLNIELLQNGLAIANSSAQNRYGDTCMAAIAQAKAQKLNIYSGEKDPDFFYSDAIELTIRELRLHPEAYAAKKVAFLGIVTVNHDNAVFIEDYDEETGLYFGITAYYGFNMSGGGLEVLSPGNEVRIVGTMQYYEAGHAWQIAGMNYRMMKPKDPGNIQKISEGHAPAWTEITEEKFHSTVTIATDEGESAFPFAALAEGTSVEVKGLPVADVIAFGEDSPNHGAHLLALGFDQKIWVYVPRLYGEDGHLLTQADFSGKTVDARGIVTYSDCLDDLCVRVYIPGNITLYAQSE